MAERQLKYTLSLLDHFSGPFQRATGRGQRGYKDLERADGRYRRSVVSTTQRLQRMQGGIMALVGSVGLSRLGNNILDTTTKMQGYNNALNQLTGSNKEGAKAMDFIRKSSDKLGLALDPAIDGYVKLLASARGTRMESNVQSVFEGVSTAVAAMNLDAEKSKGVFLALSQIMSKGKVQAEELRGQLGERLPGAFQTAARAMGMSTMQLDKLMSTGGLMADEFLPRFAAQLQKEYEYLAAINASGLQAMRNRFNTAFVEMASSLGTVFMPAIMKVLAIGTKLGKWFQANPSAVKALAVAIGVLATAFVGLSVAMMANPVGLIVAGVAALAASLTYAYNEFRGFRDMVNSVWAAITRLGSNIMGFVKRSFMPFIEALQLANDGAYGKAAAKLGEGLWNVSGVGTMANLAFDQAMGQGITKGIKDAFTLGGDGASSGVLAGARFGAVSDKETSKGIASGLLSTLSTAPTAGAGFTPSGVSVAGGSGRSVIVNFDAAIKGIKIENKNLKQSAEEIKEILTRAIVEAVADGETLIGGYGG